MFKLESLVRLGFIKGKDYGITSLEEYQKYQKVQESDLSKYPWLKSILVFIFPFSNKPVKKERYLSARFAYGEDYHEVVRVELEEIAKELKLENYSVMTDISFFDEKLLAYTAGLGGYGKNNLIISKDYGTNFAIGEILTDKILDYNNVFITSPCKDCTICLSACPTSAITETGFIRSKCISYLTQYISDEFHLYDKVLNKAIGCDICQVVCPYNKNLDYDYNPKFDFNYKSIINLEILKKLDKKSYKEYYANKSFNWIGYLKMLRNILTLDTNNKNITIEELNYFQNKFKDVLWFNRHLEYLKGKINGIN